MSSRASQSRFSLGILTSCRGGLGVSRVVLNTMGGDCVVVVVVVVDAVGVATVEVLLLGLVLLMGRRPCEVGGSRKKTVSCRTGGLRARDRLINFSIALRNTNPELICGESPPDWRNDIKLLPFAYCGCPASPVAAASPLSLSRLPCRLLSFSSW